MPALSMSSIEQIANNFRTELIPELRSDPLPLPVLDLVDNRLSAYAIFCYPARHAELGSRHAATDAAGGPEINIIMEQELWDQLIDGGRRANRARATVAHELGHAVLHVPVMRRRIASPNSEFLLSRVKRDSLEPYRDPEWQAWAIAGCILAPRAAIEAASASSVPELAAIFELSESMMRSHLKRLKLLGRFESA
jgi:hypothetical protein